MEYLGIVLYLLGLYMHFHLADNVIQEREHKAEAIHLIVASALWPFISVYYLWVRMSEQ